MHAWAHGSGPSLVLLARWAAQAEEGVGALELLDGVLLDDGADLADGVALADDVVAGVEPGEGEVALGAAPQLATVGLRVALALPDDRVFFSHSCKDSHDQNGLENQDHQQRAALHRYYGTWMM